MTEKSESRKDQLNQKFADHQIVIINDHPAAGTTCAFVEMIDSDQHKSGLVMKVVDKDGNVYELKPRNVYIITKQ